jgi:hypothetical protein
MAFARWSVAEKLSQVVSNKLSVGLWWIHLVDKTLYLRGEFGLTLG